MKALEQLEQFCRDLGLPEPAKIIGSQVLITPLPESEQLDKDKPIEVCQRIPTSQSPIWGNLTDLKTWEKEVLLGSSICAVIIAFRFNPIHQRLSLITTFKNPSFDHVLITLEIAVKEGKVRCPISIINTDEWKETSLQPFVKLEWLKG